MTPSKPRYVVRPAELDSYSPANHTGTKNTRLVSAALNGALQAAYFIIGVRAAGLAAGPMTGLDFEGVRKEFLDDDHTPLMVVNIGKPGDDAWFPRSPRLAYDEVVTTV